MSRIVNSRVEVVQAHGGIPEKFYWRGSWRTVREIIDRWIETGSWWDGEPERTYFLTCADNGGVYELCSEAGKVWYLSRVLD